MLLGASILAFGSLQIAASSRALAEEEGAPKGGEEKAEGGESKKKGNANDNISGGRFAGDPIYVHIAPLILPVINNDGVEQLVTILLDVQVMDFDAAEKMHADMPRVMDALMRSLYGGLGDGALRNGNLVNVGRVKNKAIAAVSEVISRDKVKDVLVQGVSQRML